MRKPVYDLQLTAKKFMNKIIKSLVFCVFAMLVFSFAAFGQKGDIKEKRIKFARGRSSVTVKGYIADRLTTDLYLVRARAGQTLTVVFNSPRKDIDVCLHFPDNRDYCGKRKYSFKIETDGDFEILVDGHRENISYTLTVSVK
jgi:hypothetical protein